MAGLKMTGVDVPAIMTKYNRKQQYLHLPNQAMRGRISPCSAFRCRAVPDVPGITFAAATTVTPANRR